MKYDFNLDLDFNTSTGKMITAIKDGSKILEFGPGNGRMTNYLVNVKKCNVSFVEYDETLFSQISNFSSNGFLGDIESFKWVDFFSNETFDYILFADVLEHLRDPEEVLKQVKSFLNPNGRILITFPNLSHNSVLIDLFYNKLSWNRYGLLDSTHKTFYTTNSFYEMFKRIGMYIEVEDYTFAPVGTIEINSHYEDLPKRIQYDFRQRPFGEVYQYFFSLSNNSEVNKISYPLVNSNFCIPVTVFLDNELHLSQEYVYNSYTKDNSEVTINILESVSKIIVQPKIWSGVFRLVVENSDGMKIPIESSNALWTDGELFAVGAGLPELSYYASNIGEDFVKVKFEVLYIGDLSFLEGRLLQENRELISERKKLNCRIENYERKFLAIVKEEKVEISKKRIINQEIKYAIDSFSYDSDLCITRIYGWAFTRQKKNTVQIFLPDYVGSSVEIVEIRRSDVTSQYDLDERKKFGFEITINDYNPKDEMVIGFKNDSMDEFYFDIKKELKKENNIAKKTYFKIITKLSSFINYYKNQGLSKTISRIIFKIFNPNMYKSWIKKNEMYNASLILEEIKSFNYCPKISIVIPIYNVETKWLEAVVSSVKNQIYCNWELCLADDFSTEAYIRPMLEKYSEEDERIKVVFRESNGHISAATNSGISISTGDYIAFMDNDDEITPTTLFEIVKCINQNPSVDFIYTDEDKQKVTGERFDPFFKPNWNPTLLMGHNYITHFVVVKRELQEKVGFLNSEFDGAQDYDFVLRATELANKVCHIPKILYHWRTLETSTANDPGSKLYAYEAGGRALEASLYRRHLAGEVQILPNFGTYKINFKFDYSPLVSIIILPNEGDLAKVVKKIAKNTTYEKFEVLIPKASRIKNTYPNFRVIDTLDINELVRQAKGEFIFFQNDTAAPSNKFWLEELLNFGQLENVGVVGGKIITPNNQILNGGLSFDKNQHDFLFDQRGVSNSTLGYYYRIALPRNVFAVTEECLLIRKSDFVESGGWASGLTKQLQGIDICLNIVEKLKKEIVWTPYCVLIDEFQGSHEIDKSDVKSYLASKSQIVDKYFNSHTVSRYIDGR